jgi:peptidoglycan/LPS O-acetylase OafA/YrhL
VRALGSVSNGNHEALIFPLVAVTAILVAVVSFRCFEARFLRLKSRFAR